MYLFYFFAALLIFLGYKSLRGGIDYLAYFKREISRPKKDFQPFASVFVPCRGLDQNLSENLAAIFRQNYPAYEVIFIVDDEKDEAVLIIEGFLQRFGNSKLIVAGKAENEGQKVHNLRKSVLEVSEKSEVFVFVDSDARPSESWLKNLVEPLADEKIGCSTGYRWFISKKNNFSSQLRAVWNASIASALGANSDKNFCWGGSTAIRREIFEMIEMREKLQGTLSDDFAVTRAMKEANLPIYFVPECLTASVEDCNFKELLEFTTRQMKITRVYAPHLWKAAFIGAALFTIFFWLGFLLLFFAEGAHFWVTFLILLTIFVLGAAKAWIRLNAVQMILGNYENELNKSFLWQITLWIFSSALYFYNGFCALQSNVIAWRGIRYRLESPNKTLILGAKDK